MSDSILFHWEPSKPSDLQQDDRDERLWDILPAKDAPYDFRQLSEAETAALREALTDGFGVVLEAGNKPKQLKELKRGLLEQHFFIDANSDEEADWYDQLFFATDMDFPIPIETLPMKFVRRRLRVYFTNQFERYCRRHRNPSPDNDNLAAR